MYEYMYWILIYWILILTISERNSTQILPCINLNSTMILSISRSNSSSVASCNKYMYSLSELQSSSLSKCKLHKLVKMHSHHIFIMWKKHTTHTLFPAFSLVSTYLAEKINLKNNVVDCTGHWCSPIFYTKMETIERT